MEPCPKLLKLESGQGKEITLWIIDTVAKYNECSVLIEGLLKKGYRVRANTDQKLF